MLSHLMLSRNYRGGFRGGARDVPPPLLFFLFVFFCNYLFFDHFEELQTVFIEVKLIINNAPLTYVYPNAIKTYLTPNHLLFRRELCYSNTTPVVIRNITVLSSITDKINRINKHFCHKWRHEYVVNLRETQQTSKLKMNSQNLCCASL